MTLATSRAICAGIDAILVQLKKDGHPGIRAARYGLENLGLDFRLIWALIHDTLDKGPA